MTAIGKNGLRELQRRHKMSRRKTEFNPEAQLQSIASASYVTGLSKKYIRAGCRAGTIPHVRIGSDYKINVPLLMDQIDRASNGTMQAR